MDHYFGNIEILNVENIYSPASEGQSKEIIMLMNHVRFVHYPDCQQLILWLPDHYSHYENIQIQDAQSKETIFNHKIKNIINGSVQIVLDSLFLHPGEFELTINKKDRLQHIIKFKKLPEGQVAEKPETKPKDSVDLDSEQIVYKDGFGNVLPNEDLILREKIITKTMERFTRRLEYVSHGRDGEVIYIEGEKRIKFLMELGAYDCVFYVNIPSTSEWESTTKFPLSEREDIITFVAEQTQRDQASSCVYKISDKEISYYRKKDK